MYVCLLNRFIDIGVYTNSLMGMMLLSLSRWFLVELSAKITLFL